MSAGTVRCIPESEVEITAIHAQGAGGQNVNKVSSAVHLRFDVRASSLPDVIKEMLLALPDQRISKDGVFVMKVQTHRSQARNRNAALLRLQEWVDAASVVPKARQATRPGKAALARRLESKARQGQRKAARAKWRGEGD